MESEHYYQKNLETGKLNIYTTKAFYESLPKQQQDVFRRFCLWSKKQEAWISKGRTENSYYLVTQLKGLDFIEKPPVGEKLSFEEHISRQQERAGKRADSADARAEKAEEKSDLLYNKAKEMASVIPFGQPILVGHHSEKRDRNYRNRIHNTFGKAFEERDKAKYYEEKAEIARETAEGKKYSNPEYLTNRIKDCEKNLRILERRLLGKYRPSDPEKEISSKSREFYNGRIAEEQEKLEFFTDKMKTVNPEWKGSVKHSVKKGKGKGI